MRMRTSLVVVMAALLSLALIGCSSYRTKYNDAEDLREAKKYGQAITKYKAFLLEPKSDLLKKALDPDAMYEMGRCYKAMKNTVEAKAVFKKVVEKYPGTVAAKDAQAELAAFK